MEGERNELWDGEEGGMGGWTKDEGGIKRE